MTDRIDISEHTNALCERLGLEPAFVKELYITPTDITATIYGKNDQGAKHLVGDNVALDQRRIEIEPREIQETEETDVHVYAVRA